MSKKTTTALAERSAGFNPTAVQREIPAPTAELLTLTTAKAAARQTGLPQIVSTRAS